MAKILICDDADIINALKTYLADYDTLEAQNGKQALELQEKEKIDLVLLDIMMPQTDGITIKTDS